MFVCLDVMVHCRKYGHIVPNNTILAKIKGVYIFEDKPVYLRYLMIEPDVAEVKSSLSEYTKNMRNIMTL